jgi:lysine 2,3-aminomutase
MSRIDSLAALEKALATSGIELSREQLSWFELTSGKAAEKPEYLPFLTTSEYLDAALSADEGGRQAVLKQIIPDVKEFSRQEYELSDPLGEHKFSPVPGLVHQYPGRALILVTDRCAMFCRHCFRRTFSGGLKGPISADELKPMLEYIDEHVEIKEILLSGGDPLTLSDTRIFEIISALKNTRSDLVIRLCSRIPVVNPGRITPAFIDRLSGFEGLWFVTHFNHSAELTAAPLRALRLLREGGIPLLNQTVLLKGVNDDVQILADLFQSLLAAGVKPYYLFQADLAVGTSHLRVPLERALDITRRLKDLISGMAMPRFAVDLPGGGGKITLSTQSNQISRTGNFYIVKGNDNEEYRYPAD